MDVLREKNEAKKFSKEKYLPTVIFSSYQVTNGEENTYRTISAQLYT